MQQKLADKLWRALPALSMAAFAAVLLLYAAAVVLAGGSGLGLVLYPAAFVLLVWLPGLWLAALTLPAAGAGVRAVAAVPLGALALMLLFTALSGFAPAWLCAVPAGAAGLYWLYKNRQKLRLPKTAQLPKAGWLLLLLFTAALFLYVFAGVLPYAKPASAGNMEYSQDLLWSVGNAASAQYGMPLRDLRTAGGVLHYHFFTDVLDGLIGLIVGQSAWDSVAYYCWPLWCAALCAALYLVARGLGAGPYSALLVPFGVLFAHTSWDTGFRHVFTNMNGVLQSNFFLAAVVLIVWQAEQDGFKDKRALGALLSALAALLWGKSTIGVLVVCGLLAAALVGSLLRKKLNGWLLASALGGAVIFALLWALIYRQAINNLVFQPAFSQLRDAFIILWDRCLPALILYVVALGASLWQFKKLSFTALLVNALVPGGIAAYSLFHHYSFSQSYFLLAAVFAMWMCAALIARQLFARRAPAAAASLLCALSLAATLAYGAPVLRHGVQTGMRCAGLRPAFPAEAETITPADNAAADWLRQNLGKGQVFATNRNARNLEAADGIFHYYTAQSERQCFVESWRYAMDYSLEYHLLRNNLEVVSDGIFECETYEEAAKIARENGIDALLMYLPAGAEPYPDATPAFESGTVLIYRVDRP